MNLPKQRKLRARAGNRTLQLQTVSLICISCGADSTRTMFPGGKPLYCDRCNDPTIRARMRKRRQRDRERERLRLRSLSMSWLPSILTAEQSQVKVQSLEPAIDQALSDRPPCDLPVESPQIEIPSEQSNVAPVVSHTHHAPIPSWKPTAVVDVGKLALFIDRTAVEETAEAAAASSAAPFSLLSDSTFEWELTHAWFPLSFKQMNKEYMDRECWGQFVPYDALAKQLGMSLEQFLVQIDRVQPFSCQKDHERQAFAVFDPLNPKQCG